MSGWRAIGAPARRLACLLYIHPLKSIWKSCNMNATNLQPAATDASATPELQGFIADLFASAESPATATLDDLRDAFAVSYETAAHRFTNLATRHLDIPVHFMRVGEDGVIYKAYENDDVTFPTDVTGAIEGQTVCRYWASRAVFRNADRYATHHQYTDMGRGTYWCTTHVERTGSGDFAIDVGVPFEHARWFQGRETTVRARSTCPDPGCCRRPPAAAFTAGTSPTSRRARRPRSTRSDEWVHCCWSSPARAASPVPRLPPRWKPRWPPWTWTSTTWRGGTRTSSPAGCSSGC